MREPLDEPPASVCVCGVFFMCAYVHRPTVFSSLSVSFRLPAGRMRRGANRGGVEGVEEEE